VNMDVFEEALKYHAENEGKLAIASKVKLEDMDDLSLAYSPGVAQPCLEIQKDPDNSFVYTSRGNMVAVVTNGSAVLGLGDIGAGAGLPVMEGKALLFKTFAGVDAFPICVDSADPDVIIETVKLLEPTFGGVNLEDIKAPECFYIEERLKEETSIPIFHDDQHGTAIVVTGGILNALKLAGKDISEIRVVVNGAGASGMSVTKHLMNFGVDDVILCDSRGTIYEGREENMNEYKQEMAEVTNRSMVKGSLADAMQDADVFIGLSVADQVSKDMVRSMADKPIIFAMANPIPEIMPEDALDAGAFVVGTGRSDYANQINNVSGFPGIFRGAMAVRATDINEPMKDAASRAIADLVEEDELTREYVIPGAMDPRVAPAVAAAVAQAAMDTGVARVEAVPEDVRKATAFDAGL
jgi:malate dehydrogenase (oxaloacetate-decarboxylating)